MNSLRVKLGKDSIKVFQKMLDSGAIFNNSFNRDKLLSESVDGYAYLFSGAHNKKELIGWSEDYAGHPYNNYYSRRDVEYLELTSAAYLKLNPTEYIPEKMGWVKHQKRLKHRTHYLKAQVKIPEELKILVPSELELRFYFQFRDRPTYEGCYFLKDVSNKEYKLLTQKEAKEVYKMCPAGFIEVVGRYLNNDSGFERVAL